MSSSGINFIEEFTNDEEAESGFGIESAKDEQIISLKENEANFTGPLKKQKIHGEKFN